MIRRLSRSPPSPSAVVALAISGFPHRPLSGLHCLQQFERGRPRPQDNRERKNCYESVTLRRRWAFEDEIATAEESKMKKLSARNQLKGKVVEVRKGQTTAHVRVDLGGQIVTASITNDAVDELKLEK